MALSCCVIYLFSHLKGFLSHFIYAVSPRNELPQLLFIWESPNLSFTEGELLCTLLRWLTVLLLGLQSVIPMPSDVEFDFHTVEDPLHMLSHSCIFQFLSLRFSLPLSLGLSTIWLYCVATSVSWVTPFWSSLTISSMWSSSFGSFKPFIYIYFSLLFPLYSPSGTAILHMFVHLMEFCIILCLESLFTIFFFPFYCPFWITSFFLSSRSRMLSSTCSDLLRNRPSKLVFSLLILQLQIFFNPV